MSAQLCSKAPHLGARHPSLTSKGCQRTLLPQEDLSTPPSPYGCLSQAPRDRETTLHTIFFSCLIQRRTRIACGTILLSLGGFDRHLHGEGCWCRMTTGGKGVRECKGVCSCWGAQCLMHCVLPKPLPTA